MSLVYFMRRADGVGPVKIGCTKFPVQRLAAQQLWSPEPLEIVASAEGSFKDEARLHREYADYRLHGEWFEASRPVLALLARVNATGVLPSPSVDDKWERMGALYRSGNTLQEIGDEFGVTRERVRQILRKSGVPTMGHRGSKNYKVTREQVAEILALAPRYSASEIARHLGIARQNVFNHLRKHGVAARRGRMGPRSATIEKAMAIADDYVAGLKTREIAERHGLMQPEIYRFLKVAGVKTLRGKKVLKLDLNDSEIVAAYEAGSSLVTIAAKHDVATTTIRKRLVAHGVRLRDRIDSVKLANARRAATLAGKAA